MVHSPKFIESIFKDSILWLSETNNVYVKMFRSHTQTYEYTLYIINGILYRHTRMMIHLYT